MIRTLFLALALALAATSPASAQLTTGQVDRLVLWWFQTINDDPGAAASDMAWCVNRLSAAQQNAASAAIRARVRAIHDAKRASAASDVASHAATIAEIDASP